MLDKLISLFKKKDPIKLMPDSVKQADKYLPDNIKNLSVANLAKKINEMNRPNKWAITRRAAQGMQKSPFVGGNHYPSYTSQLRMERRRKQIEKGMIQVSPEEKQPTQEAVNEGNS